MQQKLIVMSADALTYEDVEYLKILPNFQKYLSNGCRIEKVRSIYPTLTYPCHTTMRTGVWPDKHGVISNFELDPGNTNPLWLWFDEARKWDEDIFTAAKRAGLSTASVFWPVTGCHSDIDYLIAEYWPQSGDTDIREVYKRAGSSEAILDIIEDQLQKYNLGGHPSTEEFEMACAREIILKFQPDLMMLHPGNIDGYRHTYGILNEHVTRGVEEIDRFIGEIMSAVEQAGLLECTNLVLTSDHGQIDVERYVSPNVIFAEQGLISLNEDGKLIDWKAYCVAGGTSALVYLKDPSNREIYERTYQLLCNMAKEEVYGFKEVYTEEEIHQKEHLGGDFSFALETDGLTAFGLRLTRPYQRIPDFSEMKYARGQHGHMPDKGLQPVFIAKGPAFRNHVTLSTGNLVDHAPTFARVLGVNLQGADGRVLEEFLI